MIMKCFFAVILFSTVSMASGTPKISKRAPAVHAQSQASVKADGQMAANGDFETGDLTGWTMGADPVNSDFGVDAQGPHNGGFSAFFGSTGGADSISQVIATVPGMAYNITFSLDTGATFGNDAASFSGSFGDTQFINLTNADVDAPMKTYTYQVKATTDSTTLSFAAFDQDDYYTLDDVSVTLVPVN